MEEEILFEDAQVEEIVPHQLKGQPEKSFNESGPSSKRKKIEPCGIFQQPI